LAQFHVDRPSRKNAVDFKPAARQNADLIHKCRQEALAALVVEAAEPPALPWAHHRAPWRVSAAL